MNKFFTDTEIHTLQSARKNGGIFLKIYEREQRVDILVTDGNLGYKPSQTFDRILSSKIKEAYAGQNEYYAKFKDGACEVSLAWFIAHFGG